MNSCIIWPTLLQFFFVCLGFENHLLQYIEKQETELTQPFSHGILLDLSLMYRIYCLGSKFSSLLFLIMHPLVHSSLHLQPLLCSVLSDDLSVKSSPECRSCSRDNRRRKGGRRPAYTRPLSGSNSRCLHS